MNKVERVKAALQGEELDRVPVSFWGHDFLREWSAEGTAAAMLDAFRKYDWDYMKVNPRATYYAEAWGCRYRPSGDAMRGPETVDYMLKSAADLERIGPLDGTQGAFGEQLQALRIIADGLAGEAPFVQTVFSPLSVIARLANSDLAAVRGYMEEAPQALHAALGAVAETLAGYAAASVEAGASGIFFATVDWATYDNATAQQYDEFARPYDLKVLDAVRGADFNVLHVCRQNNMLERLWDYPVHAFNWASTQPGNLSLAEALTKTDKAVMGGVSQATTLLEGTPEQVAAEVREAVAGTGGRRHLLAPGCSVPPQVPEANLRAAAEAVRGA
jgi:uroporphyrinogen decarboxylase